MRRMILIFGLGLFSGCGPQVSSSSGDEGPADDDSRLDVGGDDVGGDDVPQVPDVGELNPCEDGQGFCDGECVDLEVNNDHSGSCGNQCDNIWTRGPCESGTCPPNYECGGDRIDYQNCNEVCDSLGTSCVDGVGCSGNYQLFYDLQGVQNCEAKVGGNTNHGSCSDPIDWEDKGGLNLTNPVAVACCCLQGENG